MLCVLMNRVRQSLKNPKTLEETEKMNAKSPGHSKFCCRTCLCAVNLIPIFRKHNKIRRTEELRAVTGLDINMHDGLSQFICKNCNKILETALKFRRKSRKAEKTLLGLLTGNKLKRKIKSVKTEIDEISVKEAIIEVPVHLPSQRLKEEHDQVDHDLQNDGNDDYENEGLDEDFHNDINKSTVDVKVQCERIQEKKKRGRKPRLHIPNNTPYKCATCNKEFILKATYRAHMRFHTNYCVCETCGKRCRNNNQLQEHKRARHGLGRIHKCAYCAYSSATKEALIIHERRHTGERPYVCDHCGSSFHRRSNLVQHIAIHLPTKNFQCDMCPKKLASRKFLQIHKHNVHTGKKYGYLCGVCSHRFEKPNKVRSHARRVHGLSDEQQGEIARVLI